MQDITTYTKAKLIGCTQPVGTDNSNLSDIRELIAYCARVSNPSNQNNTATTDKLLGYLLKHKHFSPFEMASATIEVETTRDIARQLLRHRSFSFQEFCIGAKSKIKTSEGVFEIQDLYLKQGQGEYLGKAKVYDEDSRTFKYADIKEVFNTGVKPLYKMTLANGRKIEATADHKFLTKDGFKTLREISVGDKVGVNGIPCHQNKEWLSAAKTESILNKQGLHHIASKAGTSIHTIRKWLKRHLLQFTKKEVASYTPIWNLGLPTEQQPMYSKLHTDETRDAMVKSSRKGESSNLWKGGANRPTRQQIFDWQYKYRNRILTEKGEVCNHCGALTDLEIDHIKPVKQFPEHAYSFENLQVLCKTCHGKKSRSELQSSPNYSSVESIEYIGEFQTYDMEVEHASHNYVANGICTHNSQRYADPTKDLKFVLREARLQDHKNRQNSLSLDLEDETNIALQEEWVVRQREVIDLVSKHYSWAAGAGIAKEQCRAILPEGNTMSRLYMNGTIRSYIHYFEVRMDVSTQLEHRVLALEVARAINQVFNTGYV